jgi:hypothetical protein
MRIPRKEDDGPQGYIIIVISGSLLYHNPWNRVEDIIEELNNCSEIKL